MRDRVTTALRGAVGIMLTSGALMAPPVVLAQSTIDRTANVSDGWVVQPGTLQFNFLHRFEKSPPPARKVTSFPTFYIVTGLPKAFNLGLVYATNSTVSDRIPNEYELYLRRPLVTGAMGGRISATATGAYNFASESVDGELSVARRLGPLRFLATVRGMSNGYATNRALVGVGEGMLFHVTNSVSVSGDYFHIINDRNDPALHNVWGAAVAWRLPNTPHSLSIQITNNNTGTIQGSSVGARKGYKIGFEFTIPVTLKRYLPAISTPAIALQHSADSAAKVITIKNFNFGPNELRVPAGTKVQWINQDPVQHQILSDTEAFTSDLIAAGKSFSHVFEKRGVYKYFCAPHPFMKGIIIVE